MKLYSRTHRIVCMTILSLAAAVMVTVPLYLFSQDSPTPKFIAFMVAIMISQLIVVIIMTYSILDINKKRRGKHGTPGHKRKKQAQ